MKIHLDNGENFSSSAQLNFVSQDDNIFIIDNHLAAFWCMAQLDTTKKYNFLHVDRHYDLVAYDEELHSKIHSIDFKLLSVDEITKFTTESDGQIFQLLLWDNYINLFNEKFPDLIDETIFVTQKEGDFEYGKKNFIELEIYELFNHIFESENKWIFNIDLDYFFSEANGQIIQMFSDEYIVAFAHWLKNERKNVEMIILCLSPECCGGWNESKRISDLIFSHL